MVSKNIKLKNFNFKINNGRIKKDLKILLKEDNEIINSLRPSYKYRYDKKLIDKYKKNSFLSIIGMGGSILGTKAIYDFLRNKIKKKIIFHDNLESNLRVEKKNTNLIISKSGNTLETITNANILIKKNQKNIFITESHNNYLRSLAYKIKADVIDHNNFIGGRYSVLSEVGMLPAELMGLNEKKFKQLNNLVKNKNFLNSLISGVSNILFFIKNKKFNSIILNYDSSADNLFKWYQQLVAESLGKKGKGLLPLISSMPKDNHSLMQLYLDGPKKNFFTFFYVFRKKSIKIKSNLILSSQSYLKNKTIDRILYSQKVATQRIFEKKNIPFRSFEIFNRNEQTMGELFCFFILESILLGRSLNVNPFNQPSVELIKKETKKILI